MVGQEMGASFDEEESQGVAGHGSYEDSYVEGHDRKHDQVSETNPESVDTGLNGACLDGIGAGFDCWRDRQNLSSNCKQKYKEESQHIHAKILVRPTREQDYSIFSPVKVGVHHHPSCVSQVAAHTGHVSTTHVSHAAAHVSHVAVLMSLMRHL